MRNLALAVCLLFLSGCASHMHDLGEGLGEGIGGKIAPEIRGAVEEAGEQTRETLVGIEQQIVKDINEILLPQAFAELRITVRELSEKGQDDLARLVIPAFMDRLDGTLRDEIRPMLVEVVEMVLAQSDRTVMNLEEKLVSDMETRIIPAVFDRVDQSTAKVMSDVEGLRARTFEDIATQRVEMTGDVERIVSEKLDEFKDDISEVAGAVLDRVDESSTKVTSDVNTLIFRGVVLVLAALWLETEIYWWRVRKRKKAVKALRLGLSSRADAPSIRHSVLESDEDDDDERRPVL